MAHRPSGGLVVPRGFGIGQYVQQVADPEASRDDKAAAWAVGHQVQLRINRMLKASRDDLIVSMERDGLKELGPLSIKSSAVDPRYKSTRPATGPTRRFSRRWPI